MTVVVATPAATRRWSPRPVAGGPRPRAAGKFLFVGDEKVYIRGVTYGTFRPGADGVDYPARGQVGADFAAMRAAGVNAVRTYTVPPHWLLDTALDNGLWVMAGIPWEQHVAFLDDPRRAGAIEARVRDGVRRIARHPALLMVAVGSEIPAGIVRWLGARHVERFVERLYRVAKAVDHGALVSYVNYPSTEYLHLPFLDVLAFNVYLEDRDRYEAYLARLHNLAGDRPLVMAEIGLDSRRNGDAAQARSLEWQIRSAFAGGAAGAFAFAWTDEWHRGGHDIEEWDFGLVDRARRPKPALAAVSRAFDEVPFPAARVWPRISVVVCSYNGARTIRDCLNGLSKLDYADCEVIVVNDGSTDATPRIASEYEVRLISTENRGLSAARNTGAAAATGELVAYIDDDARPDPHWLQYLAATFSDGRFAAAGGPNIAPPGDGWIADCVANAPGGPAHVLLDDRVAEHVPGCNMAFRRERLRTIGGFDPIYRAAGDDVDACWRIQEACGVIGFSPAAMVWHHRRNSIRAYWKQQGAYGKAEALLEGKWPEKYSALGHLSWAGRLYGKGLTATLAPRAGRLYGGTWGRAAYQSLYGPIEPWAWALPLMPEWYVVVVALGALAALGVAWAPLLAFGPLFLLALAAPILQAATSARLAMFTSEPRGWWQRSRLRLVTFLMHLMQPLARLRGRIGYGLSLWRLRGGRTWRLPVVARCVRWGEDWATPEARLEEIERSLKAQHAAVLRGGDFDLWDLELRPGGLASARLLLGVEEHGGGRQLLRFKVWPHVSRGGLVMIAALAGLGAAAFLGGSPGVAIILGAVAGLALMRLLAEASLAAGGLVRAVGAVPGTTSLDEQRR